MKREDTFPFWIMTLREYYIWLIDNNGEQTPELKRYKASLNPGDAGGGKCNSSFNSDWAQRYGNGCFHIQGQVGGKRNFDTYFIRILPPMGWLSLSDMFVSIPLNRWDNYRNDISYRKYTHTDGQTYNIGPKEIFDREIVFVKKDPLYAIPCDDVYVSYVLNNERGSPCDSKFGVYPVDFYNQFGQVIPEFSLNKESQQKDRYTNERSTCYKLTTNNQSYIAPGSRWGYWFDGLGSHTIQLYAAVNRVYLETISYRRSLEKKYDKWYYDGGALFANSNGTKEDCRYSAWSSVAYYNRDGKRNGNIIDETADATVDPGVLRYTSVFLASSGEYENEWGDSFRGDGAARILYLLHFDSVNKLCCSPAASTSLAPAECGLGTNRVSPGSTQCADLYRKTCKFDSPEFPTKYCLENGCRRNVKDSQSLIVCDYELKKFCNIIEDPKGPTAEKNKLLTKVAPYKDRLDFCNYQDEAKRIRELQFSDYTYTTDKRAIFSKLCGLDWRYKRLNKSTGAEEDISQAEQQSAARTLDSAGESHKMTIRLMLGPGGQGSLDNLPPPPSNPLAFEREKYCTDTETQYSKQAKALGQITPSQIKKAFETGDKDEKACADAKVVVDELNKRMSFYDKKLENIKKSNEIGRNYNQVLYPDMCSCFASTKDLKGDCDVIADTMKIRNNKPAKKVLNIDTDDPLQCNQNCAVNPVCRAQRVPDGYPRAGNYVQQGFIQDKGTCEDKNICVQTATINNEGKIGKLTINQTANCSAYKSKFCQNSVLSKCDTQDGQGLFAKRVIEEKDGGTCATNLDSLKCAKINLTPTFDVCNNGIRTTKYKQEFTDKVNEQDIIDALTTLLTPEMKASNPIVKYTKETKEGEIYTDCQDCEMGFETSSGCYLEDGKWKVRATKTKVLAQPYNKGKVCQIDNSVQITDCTSDKDCAVSVKTPDDGCVSGKRSMTFNIDSFSSGNGKTCETAVLEKVPQLFKDNSVSVNIEGRVATASILCRDCVVDYKIDPASNDGKCYFDGSKNVIKKIPFIKREALNGGKCNVDLNTPLVEECKFDQDCVFSDVPSSSISLCVNGERTLEFDVKTPPSNSGKSCSDVGKKFGSKYTKDTSKNTFLNNKLYIRSSCEAPQDCKIETKPYQSGCDINTGNAVDLYKILTPQKNGGKTCSEVFQDTIDPNDDISEDNEKVIVNKKCMGVETLKEDSRIRYGIIVFIILIILLLIFRLF